MTCINSGGAGGSFWEYRSSFTSTMNGSNSGGAGGSGEFGGLRGWSGDGESSKVVTVFGLGG